MERAIERLRRFGAFKFVRHDMQKHFNRLLIILSYTCNFMGPLIKEKELETIEENIDEEDIEENDDISDDFESILSTFHAKFPNLGLQSDEDDD